MENLYNQKESIHRLCNQLNGHVYFLTRLANTPNLQSLFLISQNDGSTFLPESTQHIILEQASRTKQLISSFHYQENENMSEGLLKIMSILEQNEQKFENREQKLHKFFESSSIPSEELKSMYLQESVLVDLLSRLLFNALKRKSINPNLELDQKEVEESIRQEITPKIIHDLRKELKDKVETNLRSELKIKLKPKIIAELKRELEPELQKEINSQAETTFTKKNNDQMNLSNSIINDFPSVTELQQQLLQFDKTNAQFRSLLIRQAKQISELQSQNYKGSEWLKWANDLVSKKCGSKFRSASVKQLQKIIESLIDNPV